MGLFLFPYFSIFAFGLIKITISLYLPVWCQVSVSGFAFGLLINLLSISSYFDWFPPF